MMVLWLPNGHGQVCDPYIRVLSSYLCCRAATAG